MVELICCTNLLNQASLVQAVITQNLLSGSLLLRKWSNRGEVSLFLSVVARQRKSTSSQRQSFRQVQAFTTLTNINHHSSKSTWNLSKTRSPTSSYKVVHYLEKLRPWLLTKKFKDQKQIKTRGQSIGLGQVLIRHGTIWLKLLIRQLLNMVVELVSEEMCWLLKL